MDHSMKNKRVDLAKNLLVMALGFCFAFAALEILLRVLGNPFGFRIKGDKIVMPVHRQYEIHNTTIEGLDEFILHEKNSLGFRGEEPPADFQEYLTILAVGGSTTECFYLSEGQTWVDKLGLRLKDHFSKMWINNAGLDGHSTYGHIVLMEDYVVRLRPDVVLFLVGANDMGLEEMGEDDRRAQVNTTSVLGLVKSAAVRSEVVALLFNLARFIATQERDIGHSGKEISEYPSVEVSRQEREEVLQRHRQDYLTHYEDRLRRLIEISRESGIEPVLITQPALYGYGVDDITGVDLARIEVGELDGQTQWEILELYNGVTRNVGDENGVLVVDLADELQKSSQYFYDVYHFTPVGAQKVAEILYARLCPFLAERYGEVQTKECDEEASW
ncbi:MAG: hypothetical protein FJ010_03975 [Chloroflexi bacterium]|nr:hypothetical protein [Chloroflexota bacterium]